MIANDKEDIIGVKVIDTTHAPDPRKANKDLPAMEEQKAVVDEGATVSELQKKKALQ